MKSSLLYLRWGKAAVLIASLTLSSCQKFLEIEPAPSLVETEAVFENDKTAYAAVAGLYYNLSAVNNRMTNAGLSIWPALCADELYNTTSTAADDPYAKNELLATTSSVSLQFWAFAYTNIYRANAIIEGLTKSTTITDSLKQQLRGETLTIRALLHFYLVNLFGDIPLTTTTDYRTNAVLPRTATSTVYTQLIRDLSEAITLLPANYPSYPVYSSSGRVRCNKWTASALLARVHLYAGNWEKAEELGNAVIGSGIYQLDGNPSNVFKKDNRETIWEISSDKANTGQGALFIPSSATARPAYAIRQNILDQFETGDKRLSAWTATNTVSGIPYTYPAKFKVRSGTTISEYNIVFRLAELYLIRAEARAHLQNLTGPNSAASDIDEIRFRAGVSATTAETQEEILSAIAKERQAELFGEWGHRWFDLKRTGNANEILKVLKGSSWQPTDELWPIPYESVQKNPHMIQNPGYE